MHNLFGDRFFGRTGPGWHEIGFTDPRITKCETAVRKAGLDYNIFLAQMKADVGSHLVTVGNKMVILREPTSDDPEYASFGFASPDYKILQNMEIAKAMDTLTDIWPCETVGALGKGETIFITLDAGEREVRGELIRQYFLVTDTRDGGTSMKIAFTPVRVVCQNTLVTGLKSALISLSMEHTGNLATSFPARVNLVKKLETSRDRTMEAFEMLAKCSLKKGDMEFILNAAYPLPKKPAKAAILDDFTDEADIAEIGALYGEASEAVALWQYYCDRAMTLRGAATELFKKFNDEFPKTANTTWAAYNAIVESADWRKGAESVPASAIWGPRGSEKKRAFAAAQAIVVKNTGKPRSK